MFFDTMKYGHMKNIMLGQKTLNVTKSYTYLGHIITDNLCDEADIKAKVGCLYGRSNIPCNPWQRARPSWNIPTCSYGCLLSEYVGINQ